jgi:hypothetical protein
MQQHQKSAVCLFYLASFFTKLHHGCSTWLTTESTHHFFASSATDTIALTQILFGKNFNPSHLIAKLPSQ